jgi:hypothetical protein
VNVRSTDYTTDVYSYGPTAGLDGINGAVDVSGPFVFAQNRTLTIDDSHSSAVGVSYVFDQHVFRRADKPAITYNSGVHSVTFYGSQPAQYVNSYTVRDSNPEGTLSINNVHNVDPVSVLATTGPLSVGDGGMIFPPPITIGPDLSNIRGAVTINLLTPDVGLVLEDTAAATPRQLDVVATASGASFQASGAAAITVTSGRLQQFRWRGGSHSNTVHVHGNPAGVLDEYDFGAGTDSLSLSSAAAGNRISNLDTNTQVHAGSGPGTVLLDDSDETNAQT